MRVNIDEIKEGGLARSWDLPRDLVDEMVKGDKAGYRAQGPARFEATLRKAGRRVMLRGAAEVEVAAPCGRCLQPAPVKVPLQFDLTFVPEDEYRAPPGEEDRGGGEAGGSFEPKL